MKIADGRKPRPARLLGSLGNPFVHSLSVTLGNHALQPAQPYNCPCPTGHLLTGVWS